MRITEIHYVRIAIFLFTAHFQYVKIKKAKIWKEEEQYGGNHKDQIFYGQNR